MSELKRYRVMAGATLLVPDPQATDGRMKRLVEGDEISMPDDLAELHRGRIAPVAVPEPPRADGESQFLSGGR